MNKLNGEMVVNGVKVKYSIEVEGTPTQILSAVKGVKDMVVFIKQGETDTKKLDTIKLDIEHKGEIELNYFGISSKVVYESKEPYTAKRKVMDFIMKLMNTIMED